MIKSQIALLQRELWEHRALYVTPAVIALLVSLMALTGQVSIHGYGLDELIDTGIVAASNVPESMRAAAISGILIGLSTTFVLAMWISTIFYTLDSLYAERKDRSILFWRSTPSTDFETVLSKLLTAVLVIPLITFAVIIATHLIVMLITSMWLMARGASAWHLIWSSAPFFDNWTATLVFLLALPLWMSPFIGWFLFVSAFTKRSPLLTAFLPIAMLPIFEKILFDSSIIVDAFFVRSVKMPLFIGLDNMQLLFQEGELYERFANESISLFTLMDLGGFLTSGGLWIGLIVCGLFTTAAIYVRRYRDDS
jgi:ABC-2 type transport system permease protein